MLNEQPDYLSYLLRLWRDKHQRRTVWRASLDSSLTGKRQSLASLDDLFAFLWRQTGAGCDASSGESATEVQREAQRQPSATRE